MLLHETDLTHIRDLYDRALYLQAYAAALEVAPLTDWRGPEGRVLAARLAGNLGSARLGNLLYSLAFREHPDDPRVRYFGATASLQRRGPYDTLVLIRGLGDLCGNDDGERAEWLSLRAFCSALLRDFDAADRDIARANAMAPGRRWLAVQHAGILELEDRYDEALQVIRACRERHPWYRPALQTTAHLLELNGRPEEAMALLAEACGRVECGALHIHLAGLHRDRQELEQALAQFDLAAAKYPLLDKVAGDSWLNQVRADLACQLGDYRQGLDLIRRIDKRHKGYFHEQVQERLEANDCTGESRQLDVPFVRQHHVTCAPATLTMLARYWGREAEHLEVADEICYDGTPYHAERRWAEQQGYVIREFTLTPDAAKALIDRGIPFTFSTVEPTNGHLQAVIGYDTARGVLLLRDPFFPSIGEVLAHSLDERYGPFGPRGMALVPPDRADLLDGLDLPDADGWDLSHRLRCHLIEHRRDDALAVLEELEAEGEDSTLALATRLSLADYDGDATARARLVETLLERYPKCPAIAFRWFHCLREQGRHDAAADLLNDWRSRKHKHPVFLEEYASHLSQDARYEDQAGMLLREAIRRGPRTAENYHNLAALRWSQHEQDEAAELYRVSACLEDRKEHYALAYFRAELVRGNEQEALDLLHRREERFGDKAVGPAKTLVMAYRLLGRPHDGLGVLDQALKRRPDDGDLILFYANELGEVGRYDDAVAMLDRAKGKAHDTAWLRSAAFLARDSGDNQRALETWQRVAELAPLDLTAHQELTQLYARLHGPDAGVEHLRRCVEAFPYHIGLLHLLYETTRARSAVESDDALQRIIEHHPNNAWAYRERGYNLLDRPGGIDEAQRCCETAYAIDPRAPETLGLRGRIARLQGRPDDARTEYRAALTRDPDYIYAIQELVDLAPDLQQRREALAFVFEQLRSRPVFGAGIAAYGQAARRALSDDEIERDLRTILDGRETLYPAWAALIDHLMRVGHHDDARAVTKQAVERFPLTPELWNWLAEIERVRLDRPAQVACLERAIEVSPDNRHAVRELAEVYQFDGRMDEAVALMEQAIARDPHDMQAHAMLADLWFAAGRRDEAFDLLVKALEVDPYIDPLWGRLGYFAEVLGRADDLNILVRAVPDRRPGEAHAWMTAAYHLQGPDTINERLEAVDRCIAIAPMMVEAHDFKAQALCHARRHADALRACDPPELGGDVPFNLRGRAAWVEADRGNVQQALDQMWALLDEHPDYTWGLEQVCAWSADTGDAAGLTKAAERLVEIEPDNPVFLNYRAFAALTQLATGHRHTRDEQRALRDQAKQDLEHVAQLDPSNGYSTVKLIELHLEDKEYASALAVLERAKGYLRDEEWWGKAAEVHARRGDKSACKEALTQLCRVPTDNAAALEAAFAEGRKLGVAADVLRDCINEPDTNPAVAAQFVADDLDRARWKQALAKVDALRPEPAKWDHAAGALLGCYARDPSQRKSLVRFVENNRGLLAHSEQAWGQAGYALVNHDLTAMVHDHFAGWRDRPNVRPWMLTNLACAHMNDGQLPQAAEITGYCLTLPPDHSFPIHITNLAHCEAVAGDPAQAHDLLGQLVVDAEPPGTQFEYLLAKAAATARTPGPAAIRKARAAIRHARRCYPEYTRDPGANKSYRRVVRTVGDQAGLVGKLRAWMQLTLGWGA